ncbi:MAG TPA: hypothetical protein VJ992_03920, partial [Gemmatimonadales bacterium]|nr:hypothetical protein [Gemmatimonadales bacterium]
TGNPPHVGSSAQQIIMKIIAEDVKPVTEFRKSVPANVAAAVSKALEKLPADRFDSAKAFAEALTNPAFTTASAAAAAPAALRRSRTTVSLLAAACLVLAAAALWGWLRPTPTPPETSEHIVLGTLTTPGILAVGAAIAPDGSAIVYGDTVGGVRRLWIKERGAVQARPLAPLPRGGIYPGPSFSPDGQWITYTDGRLEKVARQGGSPVQISDSAAAYGAAWLDDGTIVFIGSGGNSLLTVASGGGQTRRILKVSDVILGAQFIKVAAVPGRAAVFLTVAQNTPKIFTLELATDSVHALNTDAGVAWVMHGRLLYVTHAGQLLSVAFDARHLTTHGTPTSIIQGIRTAQGLGDATLGRDGTLLYFAGQAVAREGAAGIVSVTRNGRATPLDTAWKAAVPSNSAVALSPDGSRLALSVVDSVTGNSNLFVVRLASGIATRLTFSGTVNVRPWWSTDGSTLLYVSNAGGPYGLWTKRADGSGQATAVTLPDTRPVWEGVWSRDGKWLAYRTDNASKGNGDILAVKTSGDSTPVPLAATNAQEVGPMISPDGRWVAYASDTSGQFEIYVRPFPNVSGGMWQVSTDGGSEVVWSHSGKELFYRNAAGDLVAVAVSETPTFTPGKHTTLFAAGQYASDIISHYYAVTPDDEHFIFMRPVAGAPGAGGSLVLMRNWMHGSRKP